MKITLFYNRSIHENAAYYYQLSKEAREKLAGVDKAIEDSRKELESSEKVEKKHVRVVRQKEWFERYHSAKTTGNLLMIGGRNAQQNDQLVSKYMDETDLFFHADIQGGTVVILKIKGALEHGEIGEGGGRAIEPDEQDFAEAAQFAASFSNAWKNGNASVDVYAVSKNQLTKNVSGGFVPSGAFAILGERKWFRNTKLALRIGISKEDGRIRVVPDVAKIHLKDELVVVPSLSGKEKGALAKSLAKRFNIHPDELLEILPNGKSKTIQG